ANPANAPSKAFFARCGIEPGMRVLDVGCGTGDLSRVVAEFAGPDGAVVGIDRDADALLKAQNVPGGENAAPINYLTFDLSTELPALGKFDAIVGRRVLMYLADAKETLDRLAEVASPGAVVAFQEHGRAHLPFASVELSAHRRLYEWLWDTVTAEGGDVYLAFKLRRLLREIGASDVQQRVEVIVLPDEGASFLPTLAEVMLPRLIAANIVRTNEVVLDTLVQQIESERRIAGGAILWDIAFLTIAKME
ncbi:MAG: class I SAM-dependent methyltransferase, partial [Erythrobacter sp.]